MSLCCLFDPEPDCPLKSLVILPLLCLTRLTRCYSIRVRLNCTASHLVCHFGSTSALINPRLALTLSFQHASSVSSSPALSLLPFCVRVLRVPDCPLPIMTSSSHPPSASTADLTLISRVRDAMDAHNLNQIDVMRDSGVSNSVLCLWLQSRYKGDNAKVNQRLARWLDNLAPPLSPSAQSQSGAQTHPTALTLPPSQQQQPQTTLPDYIVPIRLHGVIGSQSYTDCFLWNLHEQRLTPRQFVQQLCRDVSLSHEWLQPLTQQFKHQIKQHRTLLTSPPTSPPITASGRPILSSHPLLRLRLDLTLDGVRLTDQLLWDPSHPHSSPEEYARVVVGDLGLGGEWTPLIAWSIRDQLLAAAEGRTGEGSVEEVPWLAVDDDEEGEAATVAAEAADEGKRLRDEEGDVEEGRSAKRAAVEVEGRKVAVFRVGAESDGWGPELQQVWDKLADMDSSGVSSVGVISAVTEYEREKEADKQAQRDRKRQEKEREKERDQQATAQQIRQQQQQQMAQAPVVAVEHFNYR